MKTHPRKMIVAFALIVCGVMVANLLTELTSPNARLMFPLWTLVCLAPAYWYSHRLGLVSYAPRDVLGAAAIVLIAIGVMELWGKMRPLSAVSLAALVCGLFFVRRRWLK